MAGVLGAYPNDSGFEDLTAARRDTRKWHPYCDLNTKCLFRKEEVFQLAYKGMKKWHQTWVLTPAASRLEDVNALGASGM